MAAATVCRGCFRTRALAREEQAVRQSIAATVHQWIADVFALPEDHRQELWTRLLEAARSAKIEAAALLPDSFDEAVAMVIFTGTARAAGAAQQAEHEPRRPSRLLRFSRAPRSIKKHSMTDVEDHNLLPVCDVTRERI